MPHASDACHGSRSPAVAGWQRRHPRVRRRAAIRPAGFSAGGEVAAVEQDIRLVRETKTAIHIQHISCAGAIAPFAPRNASIWP